MSPRATAAAALALVALAGGCGADEEGEPIPSRFATALDNRLDRVQQAISLGTLSGCQTALDIEPQVTQIIDTMPQDVDADVRDSLAQSFDHLFELVGGECADLSDTETETTPTETETTPTETETVPTETVPIPTETEPPATVPTTPEVPTDTGSDGGGAEALGEGE